jgi:hypothetical protein
MLGWLACAVGTFVLSLIFAGRVLRLRGRMIGPPFARHARKWAGLIVVGTAITSTTAGLLIGVASGHVVVTWAGVLVPAVLGLAQIPPQRDRDMRLPTVLSVLKLPFSRLYECMGDDLQDWCDIRLSATSADPQWIADAVNYYYDQVGREVTSSVALADLDRWRISISHKIRVVGLIRKSASEEQLCAALQMHPDTENSRKYNTDDRTRLAARLRTEASSELNLFLAYIYPVGHSKLLIYPFRPSIQRVRPRAPT